MRTGTARCLALLAWGRTCSGWISPQIPFKSFLFRGGLLSMSTSAQQQETTGTVLVAQNLDSVRQRMAAACGSTNVRLVAVSKTKPMELLMDAYNHGQRVFGENYAQELVGKAQQMPTDIEWHFIGPLQSNKANMLVKTVIPRASKLCIETVATVKLANKLQNAMAEFETKSLHVFVQVNTSGEETKSGVNPGKNVVDLCRHVVEACPRLRLCGLMTIGAPGETNAFDVLKACRDETAETLGLPSLELSMGMSGDFEQAIEKGATNIRVGSTIFGARDYSNNSK